MGVDPTQPLAQTLALAPTLTAIRTQNGPGTGQERGCAVFVFSYISRSADHHIVLGQ